VAQFRLEILTPSRRLLAEQAESVLFETWDGQMQVLAGHEALVVPVRPCVARVGGGSSGGKPVAFLAGGFATITPDKVEFFVDSAEWPEEIDRDRAHKALERAEARLKIETVPWMIERSKAAAARATARLATTDLAAAGGSAVRAEAGS
jgi:F-type H+-transporting ATPase subunit epsilon